MIPVVDNYRAFELRYSIIRRSAGVTIGFLVGHALNYAIVFGANRILDVGEFGLFYTVLLVITVAMSPLTAAIFALSRRLAEISALYGQSEAESIASLLLSLITRKGLPAALSVGLVLALIGPSIGIDSRAILFLLPATVLTLAATEVLRTSFQSLLFFRRATMLWIVSLGAQLAFAIGGLLLIGTVWSGILGIAFGATVALIPFAWQLQHARLSLPSRDSRVKMALYGKREASAIGAYSFFILFNNVDILVCYWLLPRPELDIYAASAFLPKAIIAAGFPVAQIVLPVIVDQKAGGVSFRFTVLKAIALATVIGMAGTIVLWIVVPILQRTPLAIHGIDLMLLNKLLVAAVALSAARILVVIEIAIGRVLMGLVQIAAVASFVVACAMTARSSERIAELYMTTSWAYLIMATIGIASMVDRKLFRLLFFWQR